MISLELSEYYVLFSLFSCNHRIDWCCYPCACGQCGVHQWSMTQTCSFIASHWHVLVDLVNENVLACVLQTCISVVQVIELRGCFLQTMWMPLWSEVRFTGWETTFCG
jgi:hypothetical protein